MALLKPNTKAEKEQVRLSLDKNILAKVKKYVEWAGLGKVEEFFEQAAQHIFSKDKDWKSIEEKQL